MDWGPSHQPPVFFGEGTTAVSSPYSCILISPNPCCTEDLWDRCFRLWQALIYWSSQFYLSQDPGIQDKRHGMVSLLNELCKIQTVLEVRPEKVAREGLSLRNTQQYCTNIDEGWGWLGFSLQGAFHDSPQWCLTTNHSILCLLMQWTWLLKMNSSQQKHTIPPTIMELEKGPSKISPSPNILHLVSDSLTYFMPTLCRLWAGEVLVQMVRLVKHPENTMMMCPSQTFAAAWHWNLWISLCLWCFWWCLSHCITCITCNNCSSGSAIKLFIIHLLVADLLILLNFLHISWSFCWFCWWFVWISFRQAHLHPDTRVALGRWSAGVYCNRCHLVFAGSGLDGISG